MDTNSDERRQLEKQHLDICLELNVDDDVRLESWNNYQKTIQVYTLEVSRNKIAKTVPVIVNSLVFRIK